MADKNYQRGRGRGRHDDRGRSSHSRGRGDGNSTYQHHRDGQHVQRGRSSQSQGRGDGSYQHRREDGASSQRGGSYQGRGRGGGSSSRYHGGQQYTKNQQSLTDRKNLIVPQSNIVCGTKGRKIVVETNYFPLNFGNIKKLECYHYDVIIEPDKFKKLSSKVMEKFRQQNYPDQYPVFDGKKNLYTSKLLKSECYGEVDLADTQPVGSKPFIFKIKLKLAKKVDLSPLYNYSNCSIKTIQEACQFLSVILRASPLLRCITVGRNFYSPPTEGTIDLTGGMELFYGFHQAPILAQRGPMVNVNIVHKAFPMAKNVLELIRDVCCLSDIPQSLTTDQIKAVLDVLRDKKVVYKIHNLEKTYSVNDFKRSARIETCVSDGKSITIMKYFEEKKNYAIKHPDFPLLWVGSKTSSIPILVPAECCTLQRGQVLNNRSRENPQVVKNMIAKTATSTLERKRKIMEQVNIIDYANSPYLKEFGFSVGTEFELVDARILDPPTLVYNKNTATPSKGVWDQRGKQFLKASDVNKWIIINLDYYIKVQKIKQLEEAILQQAQYVGMKMSKPDNFVNLSGARNIQKELEITLKNKKEYDLIIVIFSEKTNYYSMIKQKAELNVGCLTQCIISKTINKDSIPPSVISNILLKVNAKLDGTNYHLAEKPSFLKGNVMVMGADVTHPGPQNKNIPSFAAVTASHDLDFFQYNYVSQLQPPTRELITKLEIIVGKQLNFYLKNTKVKPDHIIFFRDGVSEGQFDDIIKYELEAIKAACKNFQKGEKYNPKITFLVVLKRHHTRFFPTQTADCYDLRNYNVPAGTCVDTGITHPVNLNLKHFYLASHTAGLGVTRPTKYCTLHDDANFSYDDIEQLSYYLCHMYSRCTRAVSYPAPTYYAHLAAERAKNLLKGVDVDWKNLEKNEKIDISTKVLRPMCFV